MITLATANVLTMEECATEGQRAARISISGRRAELGAVFHENSLAVVAIQEHSVRQWRLRVLGGSLLEANFAYCEGDVAASRVVTGRALQGLRVGGTRGKPCSVVDVLQAGSLGDWH